jgi:hypothetical protein
MAATRTQGITVDTDANFTINKEYRGTRLFFRLGKLSQDQAEQRLHGDRPRRLRAGAESACASTVCALRGTLPRPSPEISVHLTSLPYTSGY